MWFLYSIFSALIYASRSVIEKSFLNTIDKYVMAFGLRFFALPFFILPFLIYPDLRHEFNNLNSTFWYATLLGSFITTPLEMILYYKALQIETVSFVIPLLAISPLFTTLLNMVVFNDSPSMVGIFGMIFLILGVYFLKVEYLHEGVLKPLSYLFKNTAFKFMSLMLVFNSIGIIIDKTAIVNSNAYVYALSNYFFVSLSLFVLALYKSRNKFHQIKEKSKQLLLLGSIVGIYTILRSLALSQGNAGYVSSIMSTSILFSIIFSYVFLKEKGLSKKLLSILFIIVGLVLIRLFG